MSDTYDYSALLRLMEGGGGIPVQNAGAVDDFGGQMTDLNKQAGLATDWDFLAQNPGLIGAGGLSDITTYSPLELQFETMANAYRMSDDPRLSEIMAYVDAGVWDPMVIARDAAERTAAAEGKDVDSLTLDTAFIESAINALSQAQLDDEVAKQGAELMVDSDGVEKWMKGETKEHPFLEHARSLGYVSDPRDTYDPYSIAPAGQREMDARTMRRYSDSKLASEDAMRAYSEAAGTKFDRDRILRDRAGSQADPGRKGDSSTRARIYSDYLPRFGPGSTSMGREPAVAGEYGGSGNNPIPRGASNEEYAALGRASREAGLAAWRADAAARTADSQARAREQVVRQLRDAGYSPFGDEVRRRNSRIVPGL